MISRLKDDLNFESSSSVEIWDFVKEEAKKGNNLAKIAFFLFCIEILTAFGLFGIIFLKNIKVY